MQRKTEEQRGAAHLSDGLRQFCVVLQAAAAANGCVNGLFKREFEGLNRARFAPLPLGRTRCVK